MPSRKVGYKRKSTRRTTYRKRKAPYRRKWGTRTTRYPGFPKNRTVTMRYVTYEDFTLSAAGNISRVYSANNINDPQFSAGGHQPMGHDTWQSLYSKYMVVGSKINIEFVSDVTQNVSAICSVGLFTDPNDARPPIQMIESGDTSYRMMNGFASINKVHLKRSFSARKFFDIKDPKDNYDQYGAEFGSNPTEQAFYVIKVGTIDNTTATATFRAMITIDYLVTVGDPKVLAQS